jgi:type I restriction enzyme, R subunit
VGFFQGVKAAVAKRITMPAPSRGVSIVGVDRPVQAIVDRAVAPEGVVDLFALAGLERPATPDGIALYAGAGRPRLT